MRYSIAIMLVVLLIVGATCAALADPTTDKSGKFTIEIAQGWAQGTGTDLFNLAAENKIAQLSISSEATPEGLTLDIFRSMYVKQAKQALKGFSLSTKDKITIDGNPAGLWVYTATVDGVKLKFKNIVLFKGGQMYNIVFATLPDLYKKDVDGLDKMLSSWKWL